jgi:hypothetical protein
LNGYEVWSGGEWTLALGGQDAGNTTFSHAVVSGIAIGSEIHFEECKVGNATVPPCHFDHCSFTGTLTVGSTGDFLFSDCMSQVAGAGSPTVDLAAVGATTISFRRWSGGLTLANVAVGDVISVDAVSGGTVTVGGTGGTVHIRGMVAVTDNSGGSVSIVKTQVTTPATINDEVVDVLNVDTFAEPSSVPAATASLVDKIGFLYTFLRNKVTQNATTQALRNDADSADIGTAAISDDGTTFTRGEWTN